MLPKYFGEGGPQPQFLLKLCIYHFKFSFTNFHYPSIKKKNYPQAEILNILHQVEAAKIKYNLTTEFLKGHAICHLQFATSHLLLAICHLPFATCSFSSYRYTNALIHTTDISTLLTHTTKISIVHTHTTDISTIHTQPTYISIVHTHTTDISIVLTHATDISIVHTYTTYILTIHTHNTDISIVHTHISDISIVHTHTKDISIVLT